MRKLIFYFLLISTLLTSSNTFCQDDSGVFLKGFVKTSQGRAIPAEIIIGNRSKILKTDDDGLYRLTETNFHHNGEISLLLTEKNKYFLNIFRANIGKDCETTCDVTIYDNYTFIKITETTKYADGNGIKDPFLKLSTASNFPYDTPSLELEVRGIQNQFQKRTSASSKGAFLFLQPGNYEIKPISRPYIKPFIVEILPNTGITCKFYLDQIYK